MVAEWIKVRRGLRQLPKTVIIARKFEETDYFKNLVTSSVNLTSYVLPAGNITTKAAYIPHTLCFHILCQKKGLGRGRRG